MKLKTVWGRDGAAYDHVNRALDDLERSLGGSPDIVFFHGAERCNPRGVVELVGARWPRARLHGGSSALGVMTRGTFEANPTSFGLMGLVDRAGAYGTGSVSLGAEPRRQIKAALARALEQAERPGEVPALVLLTAPPGREEELLLGIADVVGAHVPVAGGSAADEGVEGNWWQAANRVVGHDLAVVTVLFPSGAVASTFQSGYEVTKQSGKITRATGRLLHEIDGRPAAEVYDEWTGGAIADILAGGGKIVQKTSALHPLGRRAGASGGAVEFVLSFLDTAHPDGTLTLYTTIREGEQVWAMRGTDDGVVGRAGRVARASLDELLQENGRARVAGALVIFCAASAVYVRERMPEVVASLDVALDDTPYLGTFTFGEQGRFLAGGNRHGNMMISVVLFAEGGG
ncbi:MAG TPA: FIST N-terminal domain-containing protein [Polyangia bacterium]|nr:FIST N-terminal domain-containing protein [Polyangia bacterium]